MSRGVGLALLLLVSAGSPAAQEPTLPRFGFDERLDEPSLLSTSESPDILVRLVVHRDLVEPSPGELTFDALDERVALHRARPVLLALRGLPPSVDEGPAWERYVLAVSERYRGRVVGYELALPGVGGIAPDAASYAYLLKLAATQIRSVDPHAILLQGGGRARDPETIAALYREDLEPYIDGMALAADDANLDTLVEAARRFDPSARIVVTGAVLGDEPEEEIRQLLVTAVSHLAIGAELTTFSGADAGLPRLLSVAGRASALIGGDVVPLDEGEAALEVRSNGQPPTGVRHELLFDAELGATILVYWSEGTNADSIDVELKSFLPEPPELHDPGGDSPTLPVPSFDYDATENIARARVPIAERPLVLVYPSLVSGAAVTASVGLSVQEIIARHQRAQTRLDNLVDNYIASVRDEIHFRPTPVDSFDVIMGRRFYLDREGSEWEELSFSLNGARWGSDRPAFPLLQPEKVLSLPLDLRLNQDYRYELAGEETVEGHDCYMVRFEPASGGRSLYAGRVWIDRESFHKIRVEAVQTELSAPVVSNAEVYTYEQQAEIDGVPIYLLTHLSSKQLVLIAGRNLLVEKDSWFYDFDVNSPAFAERRQAARDSDRIMLRDTDEGLRYFVKRGGERVVSEELTRSAKAIAMGTTIDPSFDFPLPIFGLNYLDFDFLDRNAQFALLFGGIFALGNIQKPDLLGGAFDASFDFFGIAIQSNDVIFDRNGKVEDQSLRTVPASLGVNFGWQATDFQKLSARYDLRFDYYARDETTAEDFVTPESTLTNGFTLGYEYRRRGYSFLASSSYARRANWEPWGDVATFDPETRSYWKYRFVVGKDFFFKTFHKFHVDAGYFGGERLDRFTKYQFGLFDETRVRGVPSTAVRFGELILARASYSFNVFDQFRFEVFYDQAWGDDPDQALERVAFTGLGVGFNVRGPWHTIIRVDVGKALLPDALRGAGSVVTQFLILKPL